MRESIKEWDTTELEPDALASANVDSALSAKAAEAITSGQLAQLYPGTQIYQGGVRAFPSEWARVTANNVGTPSNWQFQAERIPYADPGAWDYSVRLATTGTPHCAPLNWSKNFPGILTLWLREQRLVK